MAEDRRIELPEGAATQAPLWAREYETREYAPWALTADAVLLSADVASGSLDAIVIQRGRPPFLGEDAWPGGFVDADSDLNSEAAARRELSEETGLRAPAVFDQLKSYDTTGRDPRQYAGVPDAATGGWIARGNRVVSHAYLGLVSPSDRRRNQPRTTDTDDAVGTRWVSVYDYLPWEDIRTMAGRDALARLRSAVNAWACHGSPAQQTARDARLIAAFGDGTAPTWNEERAGERFALALEARVVPEAWRDVWGELPAGARWKHWLGKPMAFDHRQMMADALGRVRSRLKYLPETLAALAPGKFTLTDLQQVVEAAAGRPLHKSNFRRLMREGAMSEWLRPTGTTMAVRGPAAAVFYFHGDLSEARLATSMSLPWADPQRVASGDLR